MTKLVDINYAGKKAPTLEEIALRPNRHIPAWLQRHLSARYFTIAGDLLRNGVFHGRMFYAHKPAGAKKARLRWIRIKITRRLTKPSIASTLPAADILRDIPPYVDYVGISEHLDAIARNHAPLPARSKPIQIFTYADDPCESSCPPPLSVPPKPFWGTTLGGVVGGVLLCGVTVFLAWALIEMLKGSWAHLF